MLGFVPRSLDNINFKRHDCELGVLLRIMLLKCSGPCRLDASFYLLPSPSTVAGTDDQHKTCFQILKPASASQALASSEA